MTDTISVANDFEALTSSSKRHLAVSQDASRLVFFGMIALLFITSAALTALRRHSMSAVPGMPMPGNWTMSMAWMRMPGQTWAVAAVSFVGMWVVMMAAMMLPSLAATLWRYRQSIFSTDEIKLSLLSGLVSLGYFSVWGLCGLAVFPAGVALATVVMQKAFLPYAVPIAAGLIFLLAGLV